MMILGTFVPEIIISFVTLYVSLFFSFIVFLSRCCCHQISKIKDVQSHWMVDRKNSIDRLSIFRMFVCFSDSTIDCLSPDSTIDCLFFRFHNRLLILDIDDDN